MIRRCRIALGGSAAAVLAFVALAGCADLRGSLAPNLPPETTVFVTGDLDTVTHIQTIHWDGQDPDGVVIAFEFKWIYEPGAAPAGYDSTVWNFTTRKDSTFAVFVPDGVNFPVFVVRAIDDQGARDPTPARQLFSLANDPPTVAFSVTPSDTTFPVATFDWTAADPDGDIGNASYLLWLDGDMAGAQLTSETRFTFLPAQFQDGTGAFEEGVHTAFVAAIDEGGRMSTPDSFVWNVRLPVGNVLLVDDLPSSVAGASTFDSFYRGEFDARLGAGTWSLLDLEIGAPFRSQADVRETFLFFDHVFWYSETNPFVSSSLALVEDGIRTHLDAGKNLFLTSTRLVGTGGALDDRFAEEVLGVTGFHMNAKLVPRETNFAIGNSEFLIGGSAPFDSMQAAGILPGVDAFVLADPADAAYLAPPGTLDTLAAEPWPVGVHRRVGAGQGRLVYLAFPLRGMNRSFSGSPGRSAIELRKVFDLFALPGSS